MKALLFRTGKSSGFHYLSQIKKLFQKQPARDVPWKRCSENICSSRWLLLYLHVMELLTPAQVKIIHFQFVKDLNFSYAQKSYYQTEIYHCVL